MFTQPSFWRKCPGTNVTNMALGSSWMCFLQITGGCIQGPVLVLASMKTNHPLKILKAYLKDRLDLTSLNQMESFHDLSWHVMIYHDKRHVFSWNVTKCHHISWNVTKYHHMFWWNLIFYDFSWHLKKNQSLHLIECHHPDVIKCHEMSFNLTWWHLMTCHDMSWCGQSDSEG